MCSRITANERMPLHLHLSGGAMARNRLRSFKFSMTELLWLMETPLGSTLREQSRISFSEVVHTVLSKIPCARFRFRRILLCA